MRSQSFNIDDIYIESIGVIVSKKEKEGPLGKYFTHYIDDYYFNCKTFEKILYLGKSFGQSIYTHKRYTSGPLCA